MIDIEVASIDETERIIKFLRKRGWTFISDDTTVFPNYPLICIRLFDDKTYGFLSIEPFDRVDKVSTWTQKLQRQLKKGIIP
jgi:hypothetical protein